MRTSNRERILKLKCRSHGRKRWRGDVICSVCGRVFQTSDERAPRYATELCPCGHRLMPKAGDAEWVEIDPNSLPEAQKQAWEMFQEAKRLFNEALQVNAPAGSKIVFSDKRGKLSIATVKGATASAKPKLTLAKYLEMNR